MIKSILGQTNQVVLRRTAAPWGEAPLADRVWLDEATKLIGQFWRRKNALRNFNKDNN